MTIYRRLLTDFVGFRYDIRVQLLGRNVAALVLSCVVVAAGQNQSAEDLKAILKGGTVSNNVYFNSHIGLKLKLPQPPCDAKLNTSVNEARPEAILLNCVHYVQGMSGMYTFTIAVDYATNYPSLKSTEQYVRNMRHSLERDPTQHTVQTEAAARIAELDFIEMVVSSDLQSGGKYYQAGACTWINQYLLCFEAEAPTPEAARALLNARWQIGFKQEPVKISEAPSPARDCREQGIAPTIKTNSFPCMLIGLCPNRNCVRPSTAYLLA